MEKLIRSEIDYNPMWGDCRLPDIKPMTTYDLFHDSALEYPDRIALIFMNKKWSYEKLDHLIKTFAQSLMDLGIQKGDRIGVLLPNCPQHVIAYLASTLLGTIHVPVNVMYKADELLYIFQDAGVDMLITLDLFYGEVEKITSKVNFKKIVITGIDDFLPVSLKYLYRIKSRIDGSHVNVSPHTKNVRFLDMLKGKAPFAAVSPEFDFDDTTLLLYTAGTTGKSKGVMLTHKNLVYNAVNQSSNFNIGKDDVNLVLFPMFHVSGYMLATLCMFYTGGVTIMEPRFDAKRYLKLLDKYTVSGFFAPPTVYIAFMSQPDFNKYDLSGLRLSGASGAPVPPAVQKKWKDATGLDLLNGYGLTETTAGAIVSLPNKYNLDAIGVPMGGKAKIVDAKGEVVPIGERGLIMFKGDQVAKGYWNKPDQTRKTFLNGWLNTGDLGIMDENGFIYFVDREKDLIIASGYNIAPAEVEAILMKHPAVEEVGVIGVPDDYRGETVKAFVVLKNEYKNSVTKEEIIQFGRKNMASYKYPRIVEFMDDLPKSPIMKVLRKELRDLEKTRHQNN